MKIALVLPTYGHLDYAEKAARSFISNTRSPHVMTMVVAADDGSPGISDKEYAEWVERAGVSYYVRFPHEGNLTRSWNWGLGHAPGADIVVCGNSDLIFSPGWDIGVLAALDAGYDLVGPVSNAPGWGFAPQDISTYLPEYVPSDDLHSIAGTARQLEGRAPVEVRAPYLQFMPAALACFPEVLNGFCLIARADTWFNGAFDKHHVFNPAYKMTENEVELQIRWFGRRRAVAASSFVFHYRAVSRGDKYLCKGAYRHGAR